MPLPQTRDEMVERGYKFQEHGTCRGDNCKASIEWWVTPNGKKIPYDLMPEGTSKAQAHWTSCPDADDFGSKRKGRR
jgi:hypothetical protein